MDEVYIIKRPIWIGDGVVVNRYIYAFFDIPEDPYLGTFYVSGIYVDPDSDPDLTPDMLKAYTWSTKTIDIWLDQGKLFKLEDPVLVEANAFWLGDENDIDGEHGIFMVVYNHKEHGVMTTGLYHTHQKAKKQTNLLRCSSWIIKGPEPVLNTIKDLIEWDDFHSDKYVESFFNNWDIIEVEKVRRYANS